MTQLHLLPHWNDPWAVLSLLAHLEHAPPDRHHAVAWHPGAGRAWFTRSGVSTSVLYRRWSWDPIALWRWWRLLRQTNWDTVHLWGGFSQGAAPTLAMIPAQRVVLHALRGGDLDTVPYLERHAPAPREVRLPEAWLQAARRRFAAWKEYLMATQAPWPVLPEPVEPTWVSSPDQMRQLQRLLAAPGAVVLCYDDGRTLRGTKSLLWAADILCTTWPERLHVCFTGPRSLHPAAVQFWATLRTRQRICWLPWPLVFREVFPRASVLWWNDADDLPLLLPRAALGQGVAVLGWSASLFPLQTAASQSVRITEHDPYALASATHAVLEQKAAFPQHG